MIEFATLLDPGSHSVLRFEICVRRLGDDLWRRQTNAPPLKATINHPLQDARPFGLQFLLSKVRVAFLHRNSNREGNEIEPALYSFINGAQSRFVISSNQ